MSQKRRKLVAAATRRQTNPMKQVPEDIIVDILSRLPVKSLCRFKCMSKAWRNLISGSQFVKLQLNQSVKLNRLTYVVHDWLEFPRRLELDYETLVSGHEVKPKADESSFGLTIGCDGFKLVFRNMRVLGSCNGLLCIAFAPPRTLALVNPSTRETKTIFSDNPIINPCCESMYPLAGGFGYDALHDDYKVVKIDRVIGTVGVYSLKNCAWSCIGDFPHEIIGDNGVHMNGAIHWLTRYGSEEPALSITALDLTKQEFLRIPTPLSDAFWGNCCTMGGNLCIGCYRQELYEFWVMEIYGHVESWKRISLTLDCQSLPSVLDFPRSQEALIVTDGSLFIYNHRNGSLKGVNIGKIPTDVSLFKYNHRNGSLEDVKIPTGYAKPVLDSGFSYMESLVAL